MNDAPHWAVVYVTQDGDRHAGLTRLDAIKAYDLAAFFDHCAKRCRLKGRFEAEDRTPIA